MGLNLGIESAAFRFFDGQQIGGAAVFAGHGFAEFFKPIDGFMVGNGLDLLAAAIVASELGGTAGAFDADEAAVVGGIDDAGFEDGDGVIEGHFEVGKRPWRNRSFCSRHAAERQIG